MPDDLDNLIRAAMKTLDEQVPSGYFEALPNQTLARLEGSSMQQGSSGTTTRAADKKVAAPPVTLEPDTTPVAKQPSQDPDERDEDSGLHDIRNLAQSTKQRLSKRSITQNPPLADDVLASSSGSFKNIALPQPAKMISLPEMADLKEVETKPARAAKKTKEPAEKKKKEEVVAPVAIAETNLTAMPAAPEVQQQAVARSQFTLPSQQNKRSKGPLIALVGTGLAAAAGYVIFLQVQKSEDAAPMAAAEQAPQAAPVVTGAGSAAVVTAQPIEAPAAAPAAEPPLDEGAAGAGAQIAADDVAVTKDAEETKAEEKADKADNKKKPARTKGGKKVDKEDEPEKVEVKTETKAPPPKETKPAGKGEEGEPSFDALLKEAGVSEKKEAKPKLEKKSLTREDFNKGMAAVAGKAKGCYKGTQGTAMAKLTVSPSGQISKVSVGGDFAGKPEGNCVESALKGATFPPWDGGPMSFTFPVLLAD